jgi:hypothetical protein
MADELASSFIAAHDENGDLNQYWYSANTIRALVEVSIGIMLRSRCLPRPAGLAATAGLPIGWRRSS